MSLATQVLEKLFENRYNFVAPDSGPHKLPYTCSFHWFHMPDGQLVGVDVVRSDDMGRRALRVFARQPGSETVSSLLLEGPSSDWVPFVTDAPPAMSPDRPMIGRGENWLTASASVSGQSIQSVSFVLNFKVLVPGKGTGESGLLLAHMTAMDYLRMEISGWIDLGGKRSDLDRVIGYASVHFGDFLPDYAGVASVPPHNPSGEGILVNVTDSDDIKHGAALIAGKSIVYGYGCGKIPAFFLTVAQPAQNVIPLGGARLELSNVRSVPHFLLLRPTTTAIADATHISDDGSRISVGAVILDFRGGGYPALLVS
jgi:hypothetical protein